MSKELTPQQQIFDLTDKLDCCTYELKRVKEAYLAVSKRARKAEKALGVIAMGRGRVRVPAPVKFEAITARANLEMMECPIMEIESWKFADGIMHELMEMRRKEPFPPVLDFNDSKGGQP